MLSSASEAACRFTRDAEAGFGDARAPTERRNRMAPHRARGIHDRSRRAGRLDVDQRIEGRAEALAHRRGAEQAARRDEPGHDAAADVRVVDVAFGKLE